MGAREGAKPDLYERVRDLVSRQEFDDRVQHEVEEWGGLLTPDAAAVLVLDSLGRSEVAFGQVSDLYEGGEALVEAEVIQVGAVRTFARREGGDGRVVSLTIADASGSVRLVLRDEEVDLVTSGTLREGDRLKVVDGAVRRGKQGLEVTTGKWGIILPSEAEHASPSTDSQFRF
ncbi:MAG: OB-fold nucleic acid binding domain-containing protein [Thermoplasmata archaeon]|nr:OB-fold nucleic acid binding domain-containing protein [Thermoplasmata archaeon]